MNISVFCGANSGNSNNFSSDARKLGQWIARKSHTLVYGGGSHGLMGMVAEGTNSEGGQIISVIPEIFRLRNKTDGREKNQVILVETIPERIQTMTKLADMFIALPGGAGSLEEIATVFSRIHTGQCHLPIYIFSPDGYYRGLEKQLDRMVKDGFLPKEERNRVVFCKQIEDICQYF